MYDLSGKWNHGSGGVRKLGSNALEKIDVAMKAGQSMAII
jgi:hypothetical protein